MAVNKSKTLEERVSRARDHSDKVQAVVCAKAERELQELKAIDKKLSQKLKVAEEKREAVMQRRVAKAQEFQVMRSPSKDGAPAVEPVEDKN